MTCAPLQSGGPSVLAAGQKSDLDTVRAEHTPRSIVACRRLASRADPIWPYIGYGVLWLGLAYPTASAPVVASIALIRERPGGGGFDASLGLGLWAFAFAIAWLPFAWLMRRRRSSALALVRDGILIDAAIEHEARGLWRARFVVDGLERRAVFKARAAELAGGATVLWAAGARRILVFPARMSGRALAARSVSDIVFDRARGRAKIAFTRTNASEIQLAGLLGLVTLAMPLIAVAIAEAPLSELRCDRNADTCTEVARNVFGAASTSSFRLSDLTLSEVRRSDGTMAEWVARTKDGREVELSGGTDRSDQARGLEQDSRMFAAFLSNPGQRSFLARYQYVGGFGWPVAIGAALLTGWLLLAMADGWRTTLSFDRDAGTLTIRKRPALIPPTERTLPMAQIAHFEVQPAYFLVRFAVVRTLTVRLSDAHRRVLFQRSQIASGGAEREIRAAWDTLSRTGGRR